MTALHPHLQPLAFLLGTWQGRGEGSYPTSPSFVYDETVVFSHRGGPYLVYEQRTSDPASGRPLHGEMGYLRALADGGLELILAHPTGVTEIAPGTVTGQSVRFVSSEVGVAPAAKHVAALERDLDVDADGTTMTSVLRMAAVGQPLTHHLQSTLQRVERAAAPAG